MSAAVETSGERAASGDRQQGGRVIGRLAAVATGGCGAVQPMRSLLSRGIYPIMAVSTAEELTKKVIQDGKKLAYPKLKALFDVLFLIGVVLLLIKLGTLLLNRITPLDITLIGGKLIWNIGPLALMIAAGIGSGILKDKYRED
ncbi:hypothetical protein [Cohnella lubricantis]|uniref:hypothetical protein n=1 Tax=Cohnella lubricantis TaxID=2163172 RepID=UPI001FDA2C79|nr:hypothetical protein [Cohnella lubricantis]MBP2120262.1 hypothetical protein [Cohnella lubricantis]